MTRFLGDTITLTHGCLRALLAASQKLVASLIYVAQGRWRWGTATCSSPGVPMSTGSLVLYYPLSIPALAEVIGITIFNLLFFLAPPSSPQLPCLFHVPFHVLHTPFPTVILPQTERSGENTKAISQNASLGMFLCKNFHSQGYLQSEILLLCGHFGSCCSIQVKWQVLLITEHQDFAGHLLQGKATLSSCPSHNFRYEKPY